VVHLEGHLKKSTKIPFIIDINLLLEPNALDFRVLVVKELFSF
jgi:hypothetical protein